MKAAAVKKTVKATVAKKAATGSSSYKRHRTPSPSPPPSDSTLEAEYNLRSFSPKTKRRQDAEDEDMEMLAQRVAKWAKMSTGGKPPASTSRTPELVVISPDNSPRRSPRFSPQRVERQQEEPPRATPNTPPQSTTPPRGASPARMPTTEPTHMEEEGAGMGTGGFVPTMNVGREGNASQLGTDLPSTNPEDVDTVIEEVAKDVEAEADKIAVEEAAKTAAEEAAKGPTGEAGKDTAEGAGEAAAGEANKAAAKEEVANDQPSSPPAPTPVRYLKVGDGLFVNPPGTAGTSAPAEGEVFDDEALATAGLQVVDEPSPADGGPQEEQLLQAMGANFQKLQAPGQDEIQDAGGGQGEGRS
nr:myristoylated alanine-rich C-kinase substrate-like [Aegilops tauschii subsp. strangulata]